MTQIAPLRMLSRLAMLVFVATVGLAFSVPDADARRMGGGKSFGRQSAAPMHQQGQPPARDQVGQPGGQQAAQPAPVAPAQPAARPASPGNRWLGPIAGLAAGIGLAALLSHFGLIGPLANILASLLLIGLIVAALWFIWRMVRGSSSGQAMRRPLERGYEEPAYAGVGGPQSKPVEQVSPIARHDVNVPSSEPSSAARPGSVAATLAGATSSAVMARPTAVPANFDQEAFLRNAKVHFHRLQAAWDRRDLHDIEEFTTPEVFAELRVQIEEAAPRADHTDVVTLDADLLGIEETDVDYLASVRFRGTIREAQGAAPEPFEEIWNLAKRKDGRAGWLLAGIQQVQ
ncbi:MAG TPA: Tim44-like domain-containing protein [Burkholderiales bacterium]|nr:Tim44-like domain-containing protein [Burkholderiales bacterium]